jgi:hypothetical protein
VFVEGAGKLAGAVAAGDEIKVIGGRRVERGAQGATPGMAIGVGGRPGRV